MEEQKSHSLQNSTFIHSSVGAINILSFSVLQDEQGSNSLDFRLGSHQNCHNDKTLRPFYYSQGGQTYLFTFSFDKTLQSWELNPDLTVKKLKTVFFNKKPTHYVINGSKLITSDKYGDIHEIGIDELLGSSDIDPHYLTSNLAMTSSLTQVQIQDRDYLVLGDQYKKIKVFNSQEIHEIVQVWTPFEGKLQSVLQFQNHLLLLFKFFDEENQVPAYSVYLMDKNLFFQDQFSATEIQDSFTENVQQARFIQISEQSAIALLLKINQKIIQAHFYEQSKTDEWILTQNIAYPLPQNFNEKETTLEAHYIEAQRLLLVQFELKHPELAIANEKDGKPQTDKTDEIIFSKVEFKAQIGEYNQINSQISILLVPV